MNIYKFDWSQSGKYLLASVVIADTDRRALEMLGPFLVEPTDMECELLGTALEGSTEKVIFCGIL